MKNGASFFDNELGLRNEMSDLFLVTGCDDLREREDDADVPGGERRDEARKKRRKRRSGEGLASGSSVQS